MESNQSDENYEEFREEEQGNNGDRKVFIRTKTTSTKTQKSITTTTSSNNTTTTLDTTSASATSTPVPPPRRLLASKASSSTSSATSPSVQLAAGNNGRGGGGGGELLLQQSPVSPPGVCSNITTIVFRDGLEDPSPIDGDFARLESLARAREETPGGGLVQRQTRTTTTVHQRTITHLNQSQDNIDYSSPQHSLRPTTRRPTTLPLTHSSDNDSLLEDTGSVKEESATFQNIHKFTSTYESTPLSSPMSNHDTRFTSGDSLYRPGTSHQPQHHHLNYSTSFATSSPMGSPLSGSHSHGLATDEWKFSRTHQFQTKSGFYRSISQYDSHIKEIRGERERRGLVRKCILRL